MTLLVSGLAGLLVGAVLARRLDRLLPDEPRRHMARSCVHPRRLEPRRAGGLHVAAIRQRLYAQVLPARWRYLPPLGMIVAVATVHLATSPRHAALVAVFAIILLALVATDFAWRVLPNALMYPALVLAVAVSGLWPGRSALDSLAGGLIGGVIMLAVFVALPDFGFGDVKLAALLGLVSGAGQVLSALLISVLAGGLSALVLLVAGRAGRGATMAYGPYLALGAFVGMLTR